MRWPYPSSYKRQLRSLHPSSMSDLRASECWRLATRRFVTRARLQSVRNGLIRKPGFSPCKLPRLRKLLVRLLLKLGFRTAPRLTQRLKSSMFATHLDLNQPVISTALHQPFLSSLTLLDLKRQETKTTAARDSSKEPTRSGRRQCCCAIALYFEVSSTAFPLVFDELIK